MGKSHPILPAWTLNLGTMIDGEGRVQVWCGRCHASREFTQADLIALAERVGRDYSLCNRRCRCRLTPGCKGWNKFRYWNAFYWNLCDEETAARWVMDREG